MYHERKLVSFQEIHSVHDSSLILYSVPILNISNFQFLSQELYFQFWYFFFAVSRARILGDRDVLVQVGSDINLTCRAEESPDAPETVVWYKNEVRVDNLLARGGISVVTESRRRTSTLLVSKVNKMDAGNYTCVPSNARADSVMVHVIDGR